MDSKKDVSGQCVGFDIGEMRGGGGPKVCYITLLYFKIGIFVILFQFYES